MRARVQEIYKIFVQKEKKGTLSPHCRKFLELNFFSGYKVINPKFTTLCQGWINLKFLGSLTLIVFNFSA